ncbi:gliding-associated protein 45 [Babesia bovis T2Bo]|uniref:Gliding-associated protein 45, putative n=1 Tax=Babesia bovis TaxID=5865 RepID=A7AU87_BABBO|nr:gliding-associated protein 45 [Babesia bovis T2Bo]EDO06498.1 gliding-associated protein 45 [Babesia bovis T2Bo]BAN65070.1 gliding-associated protein 45, putative [Babesia bovis]|eukprot:XP_001610066.1 gliding-associated protein 45 [Babesia bovis T2Bo]
MPMCCSKKAAQRQKEYEEEVRMRKLEEAARLEQEQRERDEARKAEIERIMQEEKQAELMKKKAEEDKAEQERLAQEQRMAEEQAEKERLAAEEAMNTSMSRGMSLSEPQQPMCKMPSVGAPSSASVSVYEEPMQNQNTFEMNTYTPFDMSTVDQTARYVATKCGCSMKPEHQPLECTVCQGIDLSDAPLIA